MIFHLILYIVYMFIYTDNIICKVELKTMNLVFGMVLYVFHFCIWQCHKFVHFITDIDIESLIFLIHFMPFSKSLLP